MKRHFKKYLTTALLIAVIFCLCTCAVREPEPKPDYLKMMAEAAKSGSAELGRGVEKLRGKVPGEKGYVSFDELYLLSRYITKAFSATRYSPQLRFCAGEVILNRMASPDYPDDMESVIFQKGMYPEVSRKEINECVCPTRASIDIALRLLQGERVMEPEVVILTKQPEKEIYATFCDELLGNLYLCRK